MNVSLSVVPFYCPRTLTNAYIVRMAGSGKVLLVDPNDLSTGLMDYLISESLTPQVVLLTMRSITLEHRVRTLRRVYPVRVYGPPAPADVVDHPITPEKPDLEINCCEVPIRALILGALEPMRVLYHFSDLLFSSDVLRAGRMARLPSLYEQSRLADFIRAEILSMPAETLILPAVGPPSTILVEQALNPATRESPEEAAAEHEAEERET